MLFFDDFTFLSTLMTNVLKLIPFSINENRNFFNCSQWCINHWQLTIITVHSTDKGNRTSGHSQSTGASNTIADYSVGIGVTNTGVYKTYAPNDTSK